MMKKAIFLAFILMSFTFSGFSQTFGYVDSEAILKQVPDYKKAQEQLDKIVEGWRKDVEQRQKQVDQLYKEYQAEQVLLSASDRAKREEAIVNAEKDLREYQKQKFGTSGDLLQKRQELVKPIQDKVYAAIETIASKKKLDFIFDKSSSVAMIFANPKHDYTNDVLKELGIGK